MSKSIRLAFCGMIVSIATALMFLTGLIPIGTYALPALSGILLVVVVIELGTGWAVSVYVAVSLLSLLLAGDKEAVLLFLAFFGYYPILKAVVERISNSTAVFVIKLAVFNAAAVLEYWVAVRMLGIPEDSFSLFGVNLPLVFLAAGNVVFLVYDYAVSTVVAAYIRNFHRFVGRWLNHKK